jgi:hypothetical protein
MKSFKFGGFLLAAFILAWVFNYKKYNKSSDEKRNEDIVMIKKAFTESSRELFGLAVDAQKVGDCSALEIYSLIEIDSSQLRIFRSLGITGLRPSLYDSIQVANARCITKFIIDTNYKMRFSPMVEDRMRIKLRSEMKQITLETNKNLDTLCDCLFSRISGMTVKEYMSGYSANPEFPKYIRTCLDKQSK